MVLSSRSDKLELEYDVAIVAGVVSVIRKCVRSLRNPMAVNAAKAVDLSKRMKHDILEILNKYATEASQIMVNMADPHAPAIAFGQMALANASADYLKLCGVTPQECFTITVNITGSAMQSWIDAIVKKHGIQQIDAEAVEQDN